MISKRVIFLSFSLAACSSKQPSHNHIDTFTDTPTTITDTSKYAGQFLLLQRKLGKKIFAANNSYYMLKQFSDSTVKITWGNGSFNRTFEEPLDCWFAERLRIQWTNKDYLILRFGVGTGAWETVVFPFNAKEQVQIFDNGLCFDTLKNLLGTEQFNDTILLIQNLKTHRKQLIIDTANRCDAVFNTACIDSISINNGLLYYRWVTPNKLEVTKKTNEKRIRLKI